MWKIVTIYLSDAETAELRDFCDENQCTQYSALKTAIREFLSRSVKKAVERPLNNHEEETLEKNFGDDETSEEREQNEKPDTVKTRSFLETLLARAN